MIAALIATSTTVSALLLPRIGPRVLIPSGMLVAAAGLVILATQLGVHISYPGTILPALVVIRWGFAADVACAIDAGNMSAPTAKTPVSPRPWSTPLSRSAARSALPC